MLFPEKVDRAAIPKDERRSSWFARFTILRQVEGSKAALAALLQKPPRKDSGAVPGCSNRFASRSPCVQRVLGYPIIQGRYPDRDLNREFLCNCFATGNNKLNATGRLPRPAVNLVVIPDC